MTQRTAAASPCSSRQGAAQRGGTQRILLERWTAPRLRGAAPQKRAIRKLMLRVRWLMHQKVIL